MDNHQGSADKNADADILPRFKGLPNITEGVEDIYGHLVKRHILHYPEDGTHKRWVEPQIIVLFATGNLNRVVEVAVEDLKHPIGAGLVASILVQEPVYKSLLKKLRSRMEVMDERITEHPNFLNTKKIIDRLHCKTIYLEEFDPSDKMKLYGTMKYGSPIIALDFPQVYFGNKPSAIITINTFRSLNEAIKLCNREGLDFNTVSIWTHKLAEAYDMASALSKYPNFRFNCINVPFQANSMAMVKGNYHYEVLESGDDLTTIAFPLPQVLRQNKG